MSDAGPHYIGRCEWCGLVLAVRMGIRVRMPTPGSGCMSPGEFHRFCDTPCAQAYDTAEEKKHRHPDCEGSPDDHSKMHEDDDEEALCQVLGCGRECASDIPLAGGARVRICPTCLWYRLRENAPYICSECDSPIVHEADECLICERLRADAAIDDEDGP